MEEKEIKIEDSDMSANTSESVAEGGEFADSETNVTENATEEKRSAGICKRRNQ